MDLHTVDVVGQLIERRGVDQLFAAGQASVNPVDGFALGARYLVGDIVGEIVVVHIQVEFGVLGHDGRVDVFGYGREPIELRVGEIVEGRVVVELITDVPVGGKLLQDGGIGHGGYSFFFPCDSYMSAARWLMTPRARAMRPAYPSA